MQIYRLPALNDNYIWLLACCGRAAVVDPGEAAPVLSLLEREGLSLSAVLVTHHHGDHQGGIAALTEAFPKVCVYGPASESITGCTEALRGGEVLDFCGHAITVMALPGHTLGHLGYRLGEAVFCGDVLFGAGCGRLFEGTPVQMADSLAQLAALPDSTLLYCAHEYTEANLRFACVVEPHSQVVATRQAKVAQLRQAGQATVPLSLAEERATNPFLRLDQPAVLASVAGYAESAAEGEAKLTPDSPAHAVFAALRRWRNVF